MYNIYYFLSVHTQNPVARETHPENRPALSPSMCQSSLASMQRSRLTCSAQCILAMTCRLSCVRQCWEMWCRTCGWLGLMMIVRNSASATLMTVCLMASKLGISGHMARQGPTTTSSSMADEWAHLTWIRCWTPHGLEMNSWKLRTRVSKLLHELTQPGEHGTHAMLGAGTRCNHRE